MSCQHGENECFISKAQACAFRNASQKRRVDFLYCTEVNLWDQDEDDIIDDDITEDDIKVVSQKVLNFRTMLVWRVFIHLSIFELFEHFVLIK